MEDSYILGLKAPKQEEAAVGTNGSLWVCSPPEEEEQGLKNKILQNGRKMDFSYYSFSSHN